MAICALKLHAKDDEGDARGRGGGGGPGSEAHRREVDEAFRLFTGAGAGAGTGTGGGGGGDGDGGGDGGDGGGGGGGGGPLTLAHLKRVAMTLKQDDVDEALLRDMILEANGGAGVGRGVTRSEFDEVMRRAGAWK